MAEQIFCSFDGNKEIKGDVRKEGYEEWIRVESLAFGAFRGYDRGTQKVNMDREYNISFSKKVDKASMPLMKAFSEGKKFDEVKFVLFRTEGMETKPYLTYTFKEVYVTNVNMGAAEGSSSESESVTFAFDEVSGLFHDGNLEFSDRYERL
ncbi:MAG: hypothetical protein KatS3mg043_1398 [Rhodothermaceae bacterium]|nr:MAG: hypothetical protein KatS3mg043_1398 [Rhodothermaceae bacterium]